MLEAGYETPGRPAVLLLHGFPELAYSWRKVMVPLAAAGYHVIAPDQRGYGRTTGWDGSYDADPDPFRILNMVRDATGLVYALGHRSVAMVAGHDAGAPVAVLGRADPARRLPFGDDHEFAVRRPAVDAVRHGERRRCTAAAPTTTTSSTRNWRSSIRRGSTTRTISARAAPTTTCCTRRRACTRSSAPTTTTRAPTGKANKPHPLKARTAEEMAQIPTYYVMERDKGMAETVAPFMPSAAEIAACKWLTDAEVDVYATEYARTQFTGALQGYRVRRGSIRRVSPRCGRSRAAPSTCRRCSSRARATGASIRHPAPWTACGRTACTRMVGFHLVDGAGHWVQQEQPEQVSSCSCSFSAARFAASARA